MYQAIKEGITLLDSIELEQFGFYPRVDGHSQQVYIPHGFSPGVSVVSWKDNRLTAQPTLTSVGRCYSVGGMSRNTLCACDQERDTVNLVRVTNDTVTRKLRKREEVRDKRPVKTAVLGDSILVRYGACSLVVYENGVTSLGTMVTWPVGLQSVDSMSSDGVSSFLVCDRESNAVFVLDVMGRLCQKIKIDTRSKVRDCTVANGKLWVGCDNGIIVVMSP